MRSQLCPFIPSPSSSSSSQFYSSPLFTESLVRLLIPPVINDDGTTIKEERNGGKKVLKRTRNHQLLHSLFARFFEGHNAHVGSRKRARFNRKFIACARPNDTTFLRSMKSDFYLPRSSRQRSAESKVIANG